MPTPLDWLNLPGNTLTSFGAASHDPILSHALLTVAGFLPRTPEFKQFVEQSATQHHPLLSAIGKMAEMGAAFTGDAPAPRSLLETHAARVFHPMAEYSPADANAIHQSFTHQPGPWQGSEPVLGKDVLGKVHDNLNAFAKSLGGGHVDKAELANHMMQVSTEPLQEHAAYDAAHKAYRDFALESLEDFLQGKPTKASQTDAGASRYVELYNRHYATNMEAATKHNKFATAVKDNLDILKQGERKALQEQLEGPTRPIETNLQAPVGIGHAFQELEKGKKYGMEGLPYHLGPVGSKEQGFLRSPTGGTINIGGTEYPWKSAITANDLEVAQPNFPTLTPAPKFGELRKDIDKVDWVWNGKRWLKRPQ